METPMLERNGWPVIEFWVIHKYISSEPGPYPVTQPQKLQAPQLWRVEHSLSFHTETAALPTDEL